MIGEMIDIDVFLPDIETEVPNCPLPVIYRRLRDALIDACERANLWRYEHPEILLTKDQHDYEFAPPDDQSQIHSILEIRKGGRSLSSQCDYTVLDRGCIRLTRRPREDSSPYRSEEPPTVPNDPGPLATGYPDNLPKLEPVVFKPTLNGTNTNSSVLYLQGPLISEVALGELVIYDFSDLDVSAFQSGDRGIILTRSSFGDVGYLVINSGTNSDLVPNVGSVADLLRATDVQAAKDADTPFIAAYLRSTTSTSGYKIISNWAASAEELDFVTPPASLSSSPDSSTYVAQDQFSNPSAAAGTLVSQAQQYDYLGLQLNAAVNRSSSPTLTLEYTDGTSTFTYDVDWDYLPFEGTLSAANYGTAEWGIPANTQTVFFVKQQAVANGAQGVLGFRGKQSLWLSSFERSPAVFTDNAVTQEDIDAYQAALAALAAWERAINRPYRGIESVVTLKPTRDATTVAAVIERDYQPLIVAGTLANLLVMLNRDWTNVEMAMMYRARYEIELGHARQAIDRNFITGSQKIKPRRFAASAYRGR